jgi:hypothetical protein
MKLFIVGIFVALMLSGCATTTPQTVDVTVTKYQVVMPPVSILKCGSAKLPESFKDNKEVAKSYIKLWKHNQYCHNNMESVKDFLDNAKKEVQ